MRAASDTIRLFPPHYGRPRVGQRAVRLEEASFAPWSLPALNEPSLRAEPCRARPPASGLSRRGNNGKRSGTPRRMRDSSSHLFPFGEEILEEHNRRLGGQTARVPGRWIAETRAGRVYQMLDRHGRWNCNGRSLSEDKIVMKRAVKDQIERRPLATETAPCVFVTANE